MDNKRFKDHWRELCEKQEALNLHRNAVIDIVYDELKSSLDELSDDKQFSFPTTVNKLFRKNIVQTRPTIRKTSTSVVINFGDSNKTFDVISSSWNSSEYDPKDSYECIKPGSSDHDTVIVDNWHDFLFMRLETFKELLAREMSDYKENFGKTCEI
jgi:hypothetical protein